MLRTFMTLVHSVNGEQTLPISQLFVSANTQRFDRAPRWPLSTMDCLQAFIHIHLTSRCKNRCCDKHGLCNSHTQALRQSSMENKRNTFVLIVISIIKRVNPSWGEGPKHFVYFLAISCVALGLQLMVLNTNYAVIIIIVSQLLFLQPHLKHVAIPKIIHKENSF